MASSKDRELGFILLAVKCNYSRSFRKRTINLGKQKKCPQLELAAYRENVNRSKYRVCIS